MILKKKKNNARKEQKQEFTQKTRVYDLLKAKYHHVLKDLVHEIRPYVRDGDDIDWKHLRCFEFDENKISKTEFILFISRFLFIIGEGEGLKCKMSVFIRYLASNEHSNFGLKYRSLNTLIYRMLGYLRGCQETSEKL